LKEKLYIEAFVISRKCLLTLQFTNEGSVKEREESGQTFGRILALQTLPHTR